MAPQDLHYSLKSLLNCTCISYMAMLLQLSPTQPAFFFFFLFFWLHGCCCFLPSCSSKNFLINSYIWLVCQDFFFFFCYLQLFLHLHHHYFLGLSWFVAAAKRSFCLSFILYLANSFSTASVGGEWCNEGTLGFKNGEWKICHQNSEIWFRVQLNKYDWCTHPSTI